MGKNVLVLNQDFSAITVCSVPKAFLLVYLDKAELVTHSQTARLRTISDSYPLPSVIRLNNYVHIPYRNGVVLNRQNIFKRDGNHCVYCGSSRDLTLDHVHPRSRGGKTSWDNLVAACRNCNSRKGDQTPEEAAMPLKHRPYKPSFVMFLRDFTEKVADDWAYYLGQKVG